MTKCLAVNTANNLMSLALCDDAEVLYTFDIAESRDQGNLLIKHAKKALSEQEITFQDLDVMAVVTGPGSFTGIRIGLSAMRGLSLAANVPLIGVSSFDLYAVDDAPNNIVVIESWRKELYLQHRGFDPVNVSADDFVSGIDRDVAYVLSGDKAEALSPLLPNATLYEKEGHGHATHLAQIAIKQFVEHGVSDEKPVPYYLRPADVTISNKYRKTEGIG